MDKDYSRTLCCISSCLNTHLIHSIRSKQKALHLESFFDRINHELIGRVRDIVNFEI